MLRLTLVNQSPLRATLRVEGRVVSAWSDVLEQECALLLVRTKALHLDLTDVTFIDFRGIALLRRLMGGSVTITSCTPLIAELLKGEECA